MSALISQKWPFVSFSTSNNIRAIKEKHLFPLKDERYKDFSPNANSLKFLFKYRTTFLYHDNIIIEANATCNNKLWALSTKIHLNNFFAKSYNYVQMHPHHSCIYTTSRVVLKRNFLYHPYIYFNTSTHASIEVCITYRITGSNRFWPNFLADKRSKSRSISISRTRTFSIGHQGEKNSYGSRVIALSSLGYKVEILRSSSRVINSIDTRKFHGDELQKPIPLPLRPLSFFIPSSVLQIRVGESKRGGHARQKWRQKWFFDHYCRCDRLD